MQDVKEIQDEEIIKRVLAGEKPLYEMIVRRFNPYLYKVGRSYNFDHEDTEDLMQDTFVDAYKNLAHFETRSSFKTWIVRIMLNNCYHRCHKASYSKEIYREINENSRPMFNTSQEDTNKTVQSHELARIIESALQKIPYKYRMVFSMREMNGFNVRETANLLEISESNVKTRLSRSKSMLREIIGKEYVPQELYDFNLVYCDAIVENVMKRIENL